ncbi:hypothetical protein [Marinomonas sp. 2405UD68-3]|uniref:hypothetical protein n=1 Tax=Marinomonas sp. 2405UD68-3 TaxID=3391835 RepID=UPI0039C91A99
MVLFKALLFSAAIYSSSSFAVIGLCPTPFGPIGIIPCDLACVGGAMTGGSTRLGAHYTRYVSDLSRIMSDLTQCIAQIHSLTAKTNSQLSTEAVSLGLVISNNNQREVSAVDAVTIKFSDAISKYSSFLTTMTLELKNLIKSQIKAFEKITRNQYRYETPSIIGIELVKQYSKGLNESDERQVNLSENTFSVIEKYKKYYEYVTSIGQASKVDRNVSNNTLEFEDIIYAQSAEYFAVPAFLPSNLSSLTTADLMLADVLAKSEFACNTWQSIDPSHSSACTIGEDPIDVDSLVNEATTSKEKFGTTLETSFDLAANTAFALDDKMHSQECLNGLIDMSIELNLIDPTNIGYFKAFEVIRDYVIKTGCAALTANMNKAVLDVRNKLNELSATLERETRGLVVLESSTNTTDSLALFGNIEADEKRKTAYRKTIFGEPQDPVEDSYQLEILKAEIKPKELEEIDNVICEIFDC